MKKIFLAILLMVMSMAINAGVLTNAQITTVRAAMVADTNLTALLAPAQPDVTAISNYLNAASTVDAWNDSIDSRTLFEAMDITLYDAVTAGKRDSWSLLLQFAPVDMKRAQYRKAIVDVWGTVSAPAILTACLRKATNLERYLANAAVTTQGVSGVRLTFSGSIPVNEVTGLIFNDNGTRAI